MIIFAKTEVTNTINMEWLIPFALMESERRHLHQHLEDAQTGAGRILEPNKDPAKLSDADTAVHRTFTVSVATRLCVHI